jgi:hypothetical protein
MAPWSLGRKIGRPLEAAATFLESEWHLLRFEEPVLLTCDEPITLSREPSPQNRFLGIGPASAGLPLDSSLPGREPRHDPVQADRAGGGGDGAARSRSTTTGRSLSTWWQQLFRHPDGPPFPKDFPPLPDERVVQV